MFKLLQTSKKSSARLGRLETAHGNIETPFFMPIATKGAVKSLIPQELESLKARIILANAYHLYLTPGLAVMKKAGGLRNFMNWSGPILTDSGGFQVFSLSKIRKILPQGVEFRSHLDGSKHLLTPKKVLAIQQAIGSDIAMILDVCPSGKSTKKEIEQAVETTTKWAKQAKRSIRKNPQKYFAVIQGGIYPDLRKKSLKALVELDFDGYALGGLAVGESRREMYGILDEIAPLMPKDKPRYLMGVGAPENIIEAVKRGLDMFDCVIPTREARHGRLYVFKKGLDYETINIANARHKKDFSPINPDLKEYSKAYLHHLFKIREPLSLRLATLSNLRFYLSLMEKIRAEIRRGRL